MHLYEYMNSTGMTTRELSEKLGKAHSTTAKYRYNTLKPSLKVAKQIEKITDGKVTVDDLLGEVIIIRKKCPYCGHCIQTIDRK